MLISSTLPNRANAGFELSLNESPLVVNRRELTKE